MCGICGFTAKNTELLHKMLGSIVHRGPDAEGVFSDSDMSLGIRRLSIVDLNANQPVFNETDSIAVVMNGEIYNHDDLRRDLVALGHKFYTDHSDTEVIPHMFEEYSEDFVHKLNGMFAIALWNRDTKILYLYRDRIGKKPLYVYYAQNFFAFGSEIKALLKIPAVSNEIDSESLCDYFKYKSTVAPKTIYRDIHQLLPGEMLVWSRDTGVQRKQYWKPEFLTRTYSGITSEKEQFLHLLEDSIKIRSKCDVPFGAYLSGGIDSSSVVAMLSKVVPSGRVKTFCLGYKHESVDQFVGKNSDVFYAREMSKRFGTEHYEMFIDHNDFAMAMPSIMKSFDEPFSGTISTYFISRLIRENVTVALSGDGADELFGSYLVPRISSAIETGDYSGLSESDKEAAMWAAYRYGDRYWRNHFRVFSVSESRALSSLCLRSFGDNYLDPNMYLDPIAKSLLLDQIGALPNQVLPFVDRLSMAHSVEVRCPYLDYRVIEFVNGLPSRLKIHNGKTKIFQKAALIDAVLPRDVILRKKEGFVQPVYSWMKNELQQWCIDWLHELPKDIINTEYVNKLNFESDRAKVWNLVCFSIWYNQVLCGED